MNDLLVIYTPGQMLDVLMSDPAGERTCYNMSASFGAVSAGRHANLNFERALLWLDMHQWQVHFAAPDMAKLNTSAVPVPGRYNKSSALAWLEAAVRHYEQDASIKWNEQSLEALLHQQSDRSKTADLEAVICRLQGKKMSQHDLLAELHTEMLPHADSDTIPEPCEIIADFSSSCFTGITPARKNAKEVTAGVVVSYASSIVKRQGRSFSRTGSLDSNEGSTTIESPSRRLSLASSSSKESLTQSPSGSSRLGLLLSSSTGFGLGESPSMRKGSKMSSTESLGQSPTGRHNLVELSRMESMHSENFRIRRLYIQR